QQHPQIDVADLALPSRGQHGDELFEDAGGRAPDAAAMPIHDVDMGIEQARATTRAETIIAEAGEPGEAERAEARGMALGDAVPGWHEDRQDGVPEEIVQAVLA